LRGYNANRAPVIGRPEDPRLAPGGAKLEARTSELGGAEFRLVFPAKKKS
jgi:hypothetical protein